jgi:hypothetical protein
MANLDTFSNFLYSTNPWWESSRFRFDVIDRKNYLSRLESKTKRERLIRILIGARRVGKTSILQSKINSLLRDGVDPRKIIYLPADLRDIQERGIKATLEFISEEFKSKAFRNEIYVFIDEVQELQNWQNELKVLYDNTKINFYITGSSSLVLTKETSKLTGRFKLTHVLPLDYKEFLKFTRQKKTHNSLEEYLRIGGYPQYVRTGDQTLLQQSIESTLYRELLDYYGIRNPSLLKDLLEYLADKVTTPVSANRIAKDLKVADKTVSFYLDYLKSVYLIFPVYQKGSSNRITKSSLPKYYFNDTGVLNLFGIKTRIGHVVENSVFLELLRKNADQELPRVFYSVENGNEIDFALPGDESQIEVKTNISQLDPLIYEGMNVDVNAVYLNKDRDLRKLTYLPNLRYVYLGDFLT